MCKFGEPLDRPDGPGDWWFEGHYSNEESMIFRSHYELREEDGQLYFLELLKFPVAGLIGKWWRAETPWGDTPLPVRERGEGHG